MEGKAAVLSGGAALRAFDAADVPDEERILRLPFRVDDLDLEDVAHVSCVCHEEDEFEAEGRQRYVDHAARTERSLVLKRQEKKSSQAVYKN